jgi:hypothetical protein
VELEGVFYLKQVSAFSLQRNDIFSTTQDLSSNAWTMLGQFLEKYESAPEYYSI